MYRSSTHSNIGASKHRRRAAQAQELLYASKNIDQQHSQRGTVVRVPNVSSFLRFKIFLFCSVINNYTYNYYFSVKICFY